MNTTAYLAALLGVLAGGCASGTDPAAGGLFKPMSALDYARLICRYAPIDDYATCVNGRLDIYENQVQPESPPQQATSGPFMVLLGGDHYYGWYRSHPFAADFRVSNGRTLCRGAYNALTGSVDAVFAVQCDDGRSGTAQVVRDGSGRNGVGTIRLDDGGVGRVVFGREVLEGTPAAG
jgi:hypothetical protein